MKLTRTKQSRIATVLALALAGGTLTASCSTRIKEGVVEGSKDFLFSLLDPTLVLDYFLDTEE